VSDELKPCPFCGASAHQESCRSIECDSCGAQTSDADSWNRRTVSGQEAKPVATLHDDGYWTWKGTEPYEARFAGWRMEVYAAPIPATEAIDGPVNKG
jgi:hypothetical protein